MAAPADALTPFVLEHAAVRGAFVCLPRTMASVLACHPYPPAVARVLAELCVASALLASTLKFSGSISAQLAGEGPVRLLVVECTASLGIRAMAQWDVAQVDALPPNAPLAALAGDAERARFVLTVDPKDGGAMYQGIVALESTSVAGLFEHYLATSEQLASRLLLAVEDDDAAGLLLQRLPGASEEDDTAWARARAALEHVAAEDLAAPEPATDIIARVLAHEDVRVFAGRPVSFACACSRARVENALRIAGMAEVESILAEKGFVDVTCEFCNRSYVFSPVEARAVFGPRSAH